ncbi:hypothetical protein A1Q2_00314 [Trichosporon asahii var. asahii CBS 8904]|uniref:Uncharacterized protein n=1 Tax=Trichosporon asahii var. asahii (strain CBS 8904) TaxID=1220162 RepID=K1VXV3_TRIAC|nr:hypothetical protein A1Q2_00314 [Trichosporon asahii var. asahii CBS 8904]
MGVSDDTGTVDLELGQRARRAAVAFDQSFAIRLPDTNESARILITATRETTPTLTPTPLPHTPTPERPPDRPLPALLDFSSMSEYVIPKSSLQGKLVIFRTRGNWAEGEDSDDEEEDRTHEYKVMGVPSVVEVDGRYKRNQYMWNTCFVFRANASVEAFEPVIDSGFLSSPKPDHTPLPAVLEQLFEDLNSYSETSIPLDGYNWLELKLFPYFPNPPQVHDWDVPIPLVDFKSLQDANWDITAARVAPHINGVNHAARIAQLADADPALVRETLRHLLYYQVIMMQHVYDDAIVCAADGR